MADNVTVDNNDLSDYTVASDDDGTAQHQYVKLEYGADGTFTKVDGSNRLPVADTAVLAAVDGLEASLTRIAAGDSGAQGTVNIATTAGGTQILAAGTTRKSVMLENRGTAYVDVGFGASITATHGIRLYPGEVLWLDGAPNAEVRAISSSGTNAVSYLAESE